MKKKNAKLLSWATTIFAAACGIVAFCMIFVISIKTPGYLAKESFTGLQVALGCSINDHTIFNASAGLILAYLFPLVGACASVIGKGNKIVTLISGALLVTGGALALSIGIAIQNFPEGTIISMPLHAEGKSKGMAFLDGTLSGAVEPIGALLTVLFAGLFVPAMPYLLSFAAGAMIYVVVEELIPEMSAGEHSNVGVIMFALGFTLMMALDVALG